MKHIDKEELIISTTLAVRTLQKDYFHTRSKDILEQSKKLEKKLDSIIEEYYNNQIKIEFS